MGFFYVFSAESGGDLSAFTAFLRVGSTAINAYKTLNIMDLTTGIIALALGLVVGFLIAKLLEKGKAARTHGKC